jgi:hypothetical protein
MISKLAFFYSKDGCLGEYEKVFKPVLVLLESLRDFVVPAFLLGVALGHDFVVLGLRSGGVALQNPEK